MITTFLYFKNSFFQPNCVLVKIAFCINNSATTFSTFWSVYCKNVMLLPPPFPFPPPQVCYPRAPLPSPSPPRLLHPPLAVVPTRQRTVPTSVPGLVLLLPLPPPPQVRYPLAPLPSPSPLRLQH